MTERQAILDSMQKNATENGYFLCPDAQLLNDLIDGLATNTNRYGYGSCPCRVSCGSKKYDVDIICPCEYRDADIDEFGMCYCGLFVSKQIKENPSQMGPIPERRPREIQDAAFSAIETKQHTSVKSKNNSRTNQQPQCQLSLYGGAAYVVIYVHEKYHHQSARFVKQNQNDSNNSLLVKKSYY